ncbi:MAG TPA: NAD-dependent epimerase/dehydratase family protein [Opitutaceae bacterium]|nr:NAD-dependent epimerase/dehydratase family protein [Opitutaceae bacterium]
MRNRRSDEVLVTGGTGFLGRKLVERLIDDGRHVTVLGRTPLPDELKTAGVRFIQASLDDTQAVLDACHGIQVVFHTAARVGVWGNYDDFYRTNVKGTEALIAACQKSGVRRMIYTSTPSVVYNGQALRGENESLPLTRRCPSPYPLTKAIAEAAVLRANSVALRTVALRPHLIWGRGDPHLIPRVLARARAGKLRIVGDGKNRVDMVHVTNAVDAHLAAERALQEDRSAAAGRAYFITNDEPVFLWDWINHLLAALGEKPIQRHITLGQARAVGGVCELIWNVFRLQGEPPMTRFVADELAKDHWFSIAAARRDLGYSPQVSMAAGTAELVAHLRAVRGR